MKRVRGWSAFVFAALAASAWAADSPAPSASLHAGSTLESALAELNTRGYRIVYSNALVQPSMILRESPKSTRIEDLLREILAPWKLRAVHASNGDWLIASDLAPTTRNDSEIVDDHFESIETIDVTASRVRLATAGASETFLDRDDVQRPAAV